ncbi:cell division protein FtsZ [Oscillochloris trichoides DG-6]|uniref:Cell division protein FtsZ n=1 Tax=Oscillochloris trichoides DG-6 TaxID=765420 RepID=E1IB77_9CHLR|nr:cell division protein FtsZ [Oscillochloris trichoides]EFO81562.1 cell division protein FtsZ [Oscillochloris trichoides DG-6]
MLTSGYINHEHTSPGLPFELCVSPDFSDLITEPITHGLQPITIKVIGVGGAGGNVVIRLLGSGMQGADLIAVNTDYQALQVAHAATQICLGESTTRGLGAGGDPAVGQLAAQESQSYIREALAGADMVFVVAGMGGGTGTGAAPVVAQIARELGALTVGIVTRPFKFEGNRRAKVAEDGINQLRSITDTIITIPNDRIVQASARNTSITQAFGMADQVLHYGIQGIIDLITRHGMINVDFADIRAIMSEAGSALLGIGVGSGPNRTADAVRRAMACPLLEGRIEGASRLLLNIAANDDVGLFEIHHGAEMVAKTVDTNANIIFGAMIDPSLPPGMVKATLVATGFRPTPPEAPQPPKPTRLLKRIAPRQPSVPFPAMPPAPVSLPQPVARPSFPPVMPAIAASEAAQYELPPFLMRANRRHGE